MNLLRKTTVLFLAAILAAAMPAVAQAKGGGGGFRGSSGPKANKSSNYNKQTKQQPAQSQPAAQKIDINSASASALTTLPGITDDLAAKIIAARPFKSVSDLKSKKILTSDQYTAIKDLAVANKPAKTTKSPDAPKSAPAGDSGA